MKIITNFWKSEINDIFGLAKGTYFDNDSSIKTHEGVKKSKEVAKKPFDRSKKVMGMAVESITPYFE